MRVIVGLGNPGSDYEETRHNLGFKVVELLAENLGARPAESGCKAVWCVADFGDDDVALVMPQTFMNLSGESVGCVLHKLGAGLRDLVVVHDDMDLALGAVRVKEGGGAGGHNGLTSVIESLGSADFARVRLGIGRPPGKMDPADYVLSPFDPQEREDAEFMVPSAVQAVAHILEHGVDSAMNEYNQRD